MGLGTPPVALPAVTKAVEAPALAATRELAGTTLPKGASVAIVLASANRDEKRYTDPELFQLDRARKQHVAFGYRPHFCSGIFLTRAIGKIALEEAFKSLKNLRLSTEREVHIKGWRFRGVMDLPALWDG